MNDKHKLAVEIIGLTSVLMTKWVSDLDFQDRVNEIDKQKARVIGNVISSIGGVDTILPVLDDNGKNHELCTLEDFQEMLADLKKLL